MQDMLLFDKTVEYFHRAKGEFVVDQENQTIGFNFNGNNAMWLCAMRVYEAERQLAFYSMYDENIPPQFHLAMLEFITRANFGMILGNFEFDLSDGEVRYKTSLEVGEHRLSNKLIKPIVVKNLLMMDRYWRGIKAVSEGGNAEVAVAACENGK